VNLVNAVVAKDQEIHQEITQLNFAYLFENSMDAVLVTDEFGFIQYMNKSYEHMFKVSRFIEIGKSLYDIGVDKLILDSLKKKESGRGYVYLDHYKKTIEIVTSPLENGNHFGGIVCSYRVHQNRIQENKVTQIPIKNKKNPILSKSFEKIIGNSASLKTELMIAQRASKTDATVLIRGESGTGKEMVAYAIHKESKRNDNAFIAVNCGAIPEALIESELFGHEKGAFTGAIGQKTGKFEQAHKGTIFLDEIGDLPLSMQVKILRVLQNKTFYRVGGSEEITVDIRIVAATHKNLEKMILEQLFREDLYYRLNVIPVNLPSLRERSEDILLLTEYFINIEAEKYGCEAKILTETAEYYIKNYDWAGNIRELQNVIERIMILCTEECITEEELPKKITGNYHLNERISSNQLINLKHDGKLATMEEYEKVIIKRALNQFGSFNAAGKVLGITHKTVAAKARKYNIVDR